MPYQMSEKTSSRHVALETSVRTRTGYVLFDVTSTDPSTRTGASMQNMNTTCLLGADEQVQIISKQMCGNGIVEDGS